MELLSKIGAAVLIALAIHVIITFPFMWIWNWKIVELFALPSLGYWDSFWILFATRLVLPTSTTQTN